MTAIIIYTNISDRFEKEEVYDLAECLQLPEYIFGENPRIKEDRITALYMTLARLAYPTRLADYHLMFGWRPEQVSQISQETQSIIYEQWKHLLYFDEQRLTSCMLHSAHVFADPGFPRQLLPSLRMCQAWVYHNG